MQLDFQTARPILERTPAVLNTLLRGLPDQFITSNEGADTWSPFNVMGHLLHGERTDWIPRVEHLLKHGEGIPFPKFDRLAQFNTAKIESLTELLDSFADARRSSLQKLDAMGLTADDFARTGTHPAFGRVTLSQLLATWVAHDLDHLMQITRVLGRQFTEAVGPWTEYLRVARPL